MRLVVSDAQLGAPVILIVRGELDSEEVRGCDEDLTRAVAVITAGYSATVGTVGTSELDWSLV